METLGTLGGVSALAAVPELQPDRENAESQAVYVVLSRLALNGWATRGKIYRDPHAKSIFAVGQHDGSSSLPQLSIVFLRCGPSTMRVILFGATGMVGQGVLRECLLDRDIGEVLAIGRAAIGQRHGKLRELVQKDLLELSAFQSELSGFDACFFCLGISSAGLIEETYTHVTHDITLAVAQTLVKLNPNMTFIYISGMGTDSSERGRTMWARVKGRTENALIRLPFKAAYMLRPGAIQPLHGIKSRTRLYRIFYAVTGPILPLLKAIFPGYVTTTEQIGCAMIELARHGAPKAILESRDINAIRCSRSG